MSDFVVVSIVVIGLLAVIVGFAASLNKQGPPRQCNHDQDGHWYGGNDGPD